MATAALAALGQRSLGPEADLVTSIPGWNKQLPSNMYSGYLSIEGGKHLHYVFVESEGVSTDPVVLWLNGGPGCSSLDGFLYEHGPFEIDDDAELSLRTHRWSRLGHMLYLESPVGVGFSSADDTATYTKNNDDTAANDNLLALERFFELFPALRRNDFFLTGESYAGIYVPTLAEAIVKATQAGTWTGAPLRGIAVGNGCTGSEVGICGWGPQGDAYLNQYLLQTAFISSNLKEQIHAKCDFESAIEDLREVSEECNTLLFEAHKQIGAVNLYNVYGDCISSYPTAAGDTQTAPMKAPHKSSYLTHMSRGKKAGGPLACINSFAATKFFSNASVQQAFNVKPPTGAADNWEFAVCSQATNSWAYKQTRPNLPRDTYPLLVRHIRVLIYNGDWDACVPYTDNEAWTRRMAYPVKSSWHTWNYTSMTSNQREVGGYAVDYQVPQGASNLGRFTFITVRGGRHEVPWSAPDKALEMLDRFLKNQDF